MGLTTIPVNEFYSCIVWFTMKNMKGMKRLGEKSELLHGLHALHGEIQISHEDERHSFTDIGANHAHFIFAAVGATPLWLP